MGRLSSNKIRKETEKVLSFICEFLSSDKHGGYLLSRLLFFFFFFFGSTTIDSTVAPLLVQVQLVQVALFLEEDNTLA